jgi:hypothetical protein
MDSVDDSGNDLSEADNSSKRDFSRDSLEQEKESSHISDCDFGKRDFEVEFEPKDQKKKKPRGKQQQSSGSSDGSESEDNFKDEITGPTTFGPTGPGVVASFSFFGLVPGDENASAMSVEENLVTTLNDLAPDILAFAVARISGARSFKVVTKPPVAESREAELSVRRYLKALAVRTPVSVNVTEIGKLHRINIKICPRSLPSN